ncbi:MAG: alpha-L-fucosidase, partial [Melioribacteraceae bacterium]|nr:alpha-L-fucosidase [Melioribacteraceae bacterium]
MKKKIVLGFLILLAVACNTQRSDSDQDAIFLSKNNSILDWQDQKFSMFIHWGIYSIPAGVWNGEKIGDYAEQIKGHAEIPTEEYRKLTRDFNPILWNPDSIAILAKETGLKSIVITAKHHDGFCMFDTKYSEFDVVDATPYKKDIIKELSEACKRHGLRFGVYFSIIDWDYPGALPFTSTENSDSIPPAHHEYNLNQVEELLTNYGDISEIWFDMGAPTYVQSKEIRDLVKQIQPNCAVSGRLWNDQGDFVVMGDNYQPDFKMGVPWQTPASIFEETWGYRSWMERTDLNDKIEEKLHDLINVVSSGGNYLLNIGPKGDGSVVPYEKNVLQGIGQWLKVYGEAIYETKKSEIEKPDWGYITTKDNKLYLHVVDFPLNNKLILDGLKGNIKKAYPLSDVDVALNTSPSDLGLEINLKGIPKNKYVTVVVVEYGDLKYTPSNLIAPNESGSYILSKENAIKYHGYSGHDYYSYQPVIVKMKWLLSSNLNKVCEIDITYSREV